ncbi:MAG: hypothetical protein FJW97_06625 [Actinobacteria bacterium]|nr:hypothetical protein [Actinomycetota bacterium]
MEKNPDLAQVIDGAGPIAGLFVLLLAIAVFLLWRNMNKQLKKVDANLPMGPEDEREAYDEELTEEAVTRGEDEQG